MTWLGLGGPGLGEFFYAYSQRLSVYLPTVLKSCPSTRILASNIVPLHWQDWNLNDVFWAPCCSSSSSSYSLLHTRCLACKETLCGDWVKQGWSMIACIQHRSIHHAPPVQSWPDLRRPVPGPARAFPVGWHNRCPLYLIILGTTNSTHHIILKRLPHRYIGYTILKLCFPWRSMLRLLSHLRGGFGKMCRV